MSRNLLCEPTYGYTKDKLTPYTPTLKEVLVEWVDANNIFKSRTRFSGFFSTSITFIYILVSVYYLVFVISFEVFLLSCISTSALATFCNTIWYHRYVTHRAFKIPSKAMRIFVLWTNPSIFKEESYAIPHRVHHMISDKIGDPYGPHLGRLGSFLSLETNHRFNTEISEELFEREKAKLSHLPIVFNSFEQFKQTGTLENQLHWVARTLVAHSFWISSTFLIWGVEGVMFFSLSLAHYIIVLRNFNYHGHSQKKSLKDHKDKSVNSYYFGVAGSEWHENHHRMPELARSGFGFQPDIAYYTIALGEKLGVFADVKAKRIPKTAT